MATAKAKWSRKSAQRAASFIKSQLTHAKKIELCGSYRRGLKAVGDLDWDGKAEIVSATLGITIYDFIGTDISSGYLVKTYNCPYGSYLEID